MRFGWVERQADRKMFQTLSVRRYAAPGEQGWGGRPCKLKALGQQQEVSSNVYIGMFATQRIGGRRNRSPAWRASARLAAV